MQVVAPRNTQLAITNHVILPTGMPVTLRPCSFCIIFIVILTHVSLLTFKPNTELDEGEELSMVYVVVQKGDGKFAYST